MEYMLQARSKSALLIMDVQDGILQRLEEPEKYLARIKKSVAAARAKSIPVIFVVVGFRPGFPEISPRNKSFSALKGSMGSVMSNPKPSLAPAKEDIVVVKHRVSAFSGSDLEVILRSLGIEHLILGGIATSGVVLSTVREAADKDFEMTVLSDLCADFDEQVHAVLMEKVLPRQAAILTAKEWGS